LTAKRLELLHELVPTATRVAVLVNPANAANAETTLREVAAAAPTIGLQIQMFNASTGREIDAAFATFVHERPDAPFVGIDPFFNSRRVQIVHLATLHKLPASYAARDFAEAGGLMSYGANIADAWRQVGAYRSNPSGRQTRGPAGGSVKQVRAGHQCPDGPNVRAHGAFVAARPRRRGHRITRCPLLAHSRHL
jgi:hypothetical protein